MGCVFPTDKHIATLWSKFGSDRLLIYKGCFPSTQKINWTDFWLKSTVFLIQLCVRAKKASLCELIRMRCYLYIMASSVWSASALKSSIWSEMQKTRSDHRDEALLAFGHSKGKISELRKFEYWQGRIYGNDRKRSNEAIAQPSISRK